MKLRRFLALLLREPLAWFLAGGALIFAAHALLAPVLDLGDNPRRIAVSRADLVRFTQLRARMFSEEQAGKQFDAMTAPERRALLASYLREEALYREAIALGLDRQDYVVRRRIVQSMEFALGADQAEGVAPGEAAVRRWYEANRQLYALPPTIAFTHVFFAGPQARARAMQALPDLRAGRADPATLGDRFLYQARYADRTREEIASHFGPAMAAALFTGTAGQGWIGPLQSRHGQHLVMVERREQGRVLTFAEARPAAERDAAQAARQQAVERQVADILAGYRVVLSDDLDDAK